MSYGDGPKIMTSRGMIFGHPGTRYFPGKNPCLTRDFSRKNPEILKSTFLGSWGSFLGPKNPRTCNYINPYHPEIDPPKKCKNVHFLGPKKHTKFTRALFCRLFYYYFWRTGGDIFGKGEKRAPRGHFSTFFAVLARVMGLSTPFFGV